MLEVAQIVGLVSTTTTQTQYHRRRAKTVLRAVSVLLSAPHRVHRVLLAPLLLLVRLLARTVWAVQPILIATLQQHVPAAARASIPLRVKKPVRNALPGFTTTILILRPHALHVTVADTQLRSLSPAVIVLLGSTTTTETHRLRANHAQREVLVR